MLKSLFRSGRRNKKAARQQPVRRRRLGVEALEERAMLAGDLSPWQNPNMAADVDASGQVAFQDVLHVVNAIRGGHGGSLEAAAAQQGEGEAGSGANMYVDVNGDRQLNFMDVLGVVNYIRGEGGPNDDINFRLETTVGGTATTNIQQGANFVFNILVTDQRDFFEDKSVTSPPGTDGRGAQSAFIDVAFDNTLVQGSGGPFVSGPSPYNLPSGTVNNGGGLLDEAGNFSFNTTPVGGSEALLVSFNFQARSLDAINDNFTLSQDPAAPVPLPVLANDRVNGSFTFTGSQSTNGVELFNTDPNGTVPSPGSGNPPAFATDFGTHTVNIVGGQKTITQVNGQSIAAPVATTHGTVSLDNRGTPNPEDDVLLYTPNAGYSGSDSFSYTIGDGLGGQTDMATVSLTINPVGSGNDVVTYRVESSAMTVSAGETFTISVFTQDVRNSVPAAERGLFSGALDLLFNGIVFSDAAQPIPATLTFGPDFDPNPPVPPTFQPGRIDEVTDIKTNVGDPNDHIGPNEVLFFSIQFTAGTTLNEMTVFSLAAATEATLVTTPSAEAPGGIVPPGSINYGQSITVTVRDLTAESPVAVDDADPANDAYVTNEDTTLIVSDPGNRSGDGVLSGGLVGVLDNDTDADATAAPPVATTLFARPAGNFVGNVITTPNGGTVTLNDDGTFTYSPRNNFFGTDTFQYQADDLLEGGNLSNIATVTITVNSINDDPVANDDLDYETGLDVNLSVSTAAAGLLGNDTDADGDVLMITQINGLAYTTGTSFRLTGGSITINANGSFVYDPDPTFVGTESFTYTIIDGNGGSDTANVAINVGLTPRSISGFVYIDDNNNGLKEAGELGIGGVRVDLVGMNFRNEQVNATATTNLAGGYRFDGILPGSYTIVENQPLLIRDGMDRVGNLGGDASVNDRLSFNLNGLEDAVDYNFGELGRQLAFFSVADLLASGSSGTGLVGFDAAGNTVFSTLGLVGWEQIATLTFTLSPDHSQVTLSATHVNGVTPIAPRTVAFANSPLVRVLGQTNDGLVIRLLGTATDFFGPL